MVNDIKRKLTHKSINEQSNTAYLHYRLRKNQEIPVYDFVTQSVRNIKVTDKDLTLYYSPLPGTKGMDPVWIVKLKQIIQTASDVQNSAFGLNSNQIARSRAAQNTLDLALVLNSLTKQAQTAFNDQGRIDLEYTVREAVARLAASKPGSVYEKFDLDSVRSNRYRVGLSADPFLLPEEFRKARGHGGARDVYHDRILARGSLRSNGRETFFNLSTAVGYLMANDADGDQLAQGLSFTVGGHQLLIPLKYPGHRRSGVIEIVRDKSLFELLAQTTSDYLDKTTAFRKNRYSGNTRLIATDGQALADIVDNRLEEYTKIGKVLQEKQDYLSALKKLPTMYRTDPDRLDESLKLLSTIAGDGAAELVQKKISAVEQAVVSNTKVGIMHSKVATREVFRALRGLALTGAVSAEDLNDFIVGNLAKGSERFEILELAVLKNVKNSGALGVSSDIEDFLYTFQPRVSAVFQKHRHIPTQSYVDFFDSIDFLLGKDYTLEDIANFNPDAMSQLVNVQVNPIGQGITASLSYISESATKKQKMEAVFKKIKKPKRRSFGKNPVYQTLTGAVDSVGEDVYSMLVDAGYLRPVSVDTGINPVMYGKDKRRLYTSPTAYIIDPLLGTSTNKSTLQRMQGVFGHLGATGDVVTTGVFYPAVTIKSIMTKKKEQRTFINTMTPEQAVRALFNNGFDKSTLTWSQQYLGEELQNVFGKATGFYAVERLMGSGSYLDRMVKDLVEAGFYEQLFEDPIAKNVPYSQKILQVKDYANRILLSGNETLIQKLIIQAQLATRQGNKVRNQIASTFSQIQTDIGQVLNVRVNQNPQGGLTGSYTFDQIRQSNAGRVAIIPHEKTSDPKELALALISIEKELLDNDIKDFYGFTSHGTKVSQNFTTIAQLSRPDSDFPIGFMEASVAMSPSRVSKITSQLNSSIPLGRLNVAYVMPNFAKLLVEAGYDPDAMMDAFRRFKPNEDDIRNFPVAGQKDLPTGLDTGQIMVSEALESRYKSVLSEKKYIPYLTFDHEPSPEDIAKHNLKRVDFYDGNKTRTVYQVDIDQSPSFRSMPKLVSGDGGVKLEVRDVVRGIIGSKSGKNIHALQFQGEVMEKFNATELFTIVLSKAMANSGLSLKEQQEAFQKLIPRIALLKEEINKKLSANPTANLDKIYVQIENEMNQILEQYGAGMEEILIQETEGGPIAKVKGFVVEENRIGAVVNSAELLGNLGTPNKIDIQSELGQQKLDSVIDNIYQAFEVFGEEGTPASRAEISSMIRQVAREQMQEANENIGSTLTLLRNLAPTLRIQTEYTGETLADAAAGLIHRASSEGSGSVENLRSRIMGRLTAGQVAMVGGVIAAGAVVVGNHIVNRDREKRRY